MSSSTAHPYRSGNSHASDQQQQLFFQQQNQHGTDVYHVPQHSRREKLRYSQEEIPLATLYQPPHFLNHSSQVVPHESQLHVPSYNQMGSNQTGFSLSLSSSSPTNQRRQVSSGVPGPYGPFTGYAAVLGRSRYLGPARMLLEEICDVGRRDMTQEMDMSGGDDGMLDLDPSERESLSAADSGSDGSREGSEFHWRKSRLISMMEEVCKRYKQYYQQVQAVIQSFESVAGLSNAAPFATLALKTMAKHFKCLKSMILNQLKNANKTNNGKEAALHSRDEMPSFGMLSSGQRGNNNMANFGQPHIWRPQRGLPERAVSVLRAWLFEHFLHPYPTDTDKQMLSKQTGLTRNQVSNWFINARVRLWKPMVEEIHNLEMRQSHKHPSNDKNPSLNPNPNALHQNQQPSNCSNSNPSDLLQGQSSTTNTINRNPNSTSSRNIQVGELSQIPNNMHEPINFSYNNSLGVGFNGGAVNPSGVSLTLGLHQNNRVYLTESIPGNLVHRFGLEDCNDPYVIGSFEPHGRPFGKDVSGHLLHDFVG